MFNARNICTGMIAAGAAAAAITMAGPAWADDGSGAPTGSNCPGTTASAPENVCSGGGVSENPGPGGAGYNGIDPRGN